MVVSAFWALVEPAGGRGGRGAAGDVVGRRHPAVRLPRRVAGLRTVGGGRTHHLTVGIELLLLGGGTAVVDVGRDLDAGGAHAHDALDDILDAGLKLGLGVALGLFGRGGVEALIVVAGGQGAVVLVRHGDAIGLQIRHGRGHQIADRPHLIAAQIAPAHAHQDGGGRFSCGGGEHLAARQGDVDAGGGDAAHRHDGARQFALQGALFVQLLLELGLAQDRLVVEQLVADRARRHQSLAGDQHPGRAHLVAVDHDGRAVALGRIFDVGLVQGGGDLAGLAQVQVGIEQRVGRLAHTQHDGDQHGGHAGGDAEDRRQAADPELLQRRRKAAHAIPPQTRGRCLRPARQKMPPGW